MSNPLSQQSFPSSFTADDDHYNYTFSAPHRGLSVRRSIIHERSNYNLSPSPPPPEVTEPSQVYQGGQSQSLLQGHSSRKPVQGQISSRPKWGIGGDRDSREGVYSSVPSGDLEADFTGEIGIGAQQARQKRGRRSRSPKKDKMMPQQDNTVGVVVDETAIAAEATGEQARSLHPDAHPDNSFSEVREHRQSVALSQYDPHMEDGEYYAHNGQAQNRALYAGGAGGEGTEGYSPSTSSARGFAAAGAPIGRTTTPEGQQQMQGENSEFYNQGGDYPQQQYSNNYSDSSPLPAPLEGAAALTDLSPPNAPQLTSNPPHPSNTSQHSQASSNRRSLPPTTGAGIALIPADDSPYKRFSGIGNSSTTALGIDRQIDVNLLDENDPDDGLATPPPPGGHGRGHGILMGLRGGKSNNSGVVVGAGAVGGAAGAGMMAGHGGDAANGGLLSGGVNTTAPLGESTRGIGSSGGVVAAEKESDWLASQNHSKQKTRKITILILLLLLLAIAGGIAAGVVVSKKKSSSNDKSSDDFTNSGGTSTPTSSKDNGKWKNYLNNPALHKVFYGIDYTPLNALYPECLATPPAQAQINIDLAIMSQLTSRIRLYGTDCNQAVMVLDGIKTTGVDIKIWLGIWLDNNATTNARGLSALYDILAKYPTSMFEGVVVGNEVLFRQDMTESALTTVLKEVKTNLTAKGIDLPIGTSDLGSNWSSGLASAVDVLMANVHPFFGGVEAVNASTWTMSFYDNSNLPVAKTAGISGMVSEVGWPTGGGTLQGAVAGVDELNTFLNDWVCARIKDGLEYYWFSAFDEPWKVIYNEPGKEWEDKWGLLDADRKIKDGVVIPSCN